MRVALAAALGFIVLAAVVFALVNESGRIDPPVQTPVAGPAAFARPEFQDWLAVWKARDPYLTQEEFRLVGEQPIQYNDAYGELSAPEGRLVRSPDGRHTLDYLASYGEPDSRVDIDGRNVAFCGTPCTFDRAYWASSDVAVVLGIEESYKPDGTQLCMGEGDDRTCYRRLTAVIYDLRAGTATTYASADHLLSGDPFEKEKQERALSGASAELRAAAGVYRSTELVPFSGTVVSATYSLLSVRTEEGDVLSVTIADGKIGTRIPLSDRNTLGAGAQIEGAGLRNGDSSIVATEIAVRKPGDVFVLRPTPQESVERTFTVALSVAATVPKVTLRITDAEGEIVLTKHVAALEGSEEADRLSVTIPVTLPTGLDEGATLTLTAFAAGSDANMAVPLVYTAPATPVDN